MIGYIDGYNFKEMEPMKYFAPPASWSDKKKQENARSKIFSGDFLGAEKRDGYFTKLVKDEDGNIGLYSRSRNVKGEFPEKHEWVPHLQPFFDLLPNGTCLLAELYLPSAPGSKNITSLMGCLKEKAIARQKQGEKLHFYIFDILAWRGESWLNWRAKDRFSWVSNMNGDAFGYVSFAQYKTGKELWTMLQEILDRGDEGVVITHQDGLYEPGKRPSKTTLKIKKELKQTIDCFFTGAATSPTKEYTGKELETWKYWESLIDGSKLEGEHYKEYNEGASIIPITKGWFYGWYGSLEIGVFKHKPGHGCKIGDKIYEDVEICSLGYLSGLTEEIKANPKEYAFKPIEVTAMELDVSSFTLRHGKLVAFRPDLNITECTYEKIIGM